MTDDRGQVVRLSQRDWTRIVLGVASGVLVLGATWVSMQVSVARLEEQVNSLEARISILEMTIRANSWSLGP